MQHQYKSKRPQCKCLWCGRDRPWFPTHDCGATNAVRAAVAGYASQYGRTWKAALRRAWEQGKDLGPELQQARNVIGPTGLARITAAVVDDIVDALS